MPGVRGKDVSRDWWAFRIGLIKLNAFAVAESLFLAAAKKSNQKKAAFPRHSAIAKQVSTPIFRLAIHGSTENGARTVRRPYGVLHVELADVRLQEREKELQLHLRFCSCRCISLAIAFDAKNQHHKTRSHTRRAARGSATFSVPEPRTARSENADTSHQTVRVALTGKAPFLW